MKKGFSLIELAVALVIISVLAAIILSGAGIKKTARVNGAKSLTSAANLGSLGDLIFWIETSDVSNLDIETDGTISGWKDISSLTSGVSVEQSTVSARPTYVEEAINGLPVVRFDGTNDVLTANNSKLTIDDEVTVFAVYSSDVGTGEDGFITQVSCSAGRDGYTLARLTSSGVFRAYHYTNSTISTPQTISAAADSYIAIYKYDQGSVTMQQNEAISTASSSFAAPAQPLLYIGSGSNCSTGFYANIDFGEVIIFNRALEAAEISEIVRYLSQKWKISATYLGS
jgi:prepilin-type N-terminal cleavage/methylation domain-containing protein